MRAAAAAAAAMPPTQSGLIYRLADSIKMWIESGNKIEDGMMYVFLIIVYRQTFPMEQNWFHLFSLSELVWI